MIRSQGTLIKSPTTIWQGNTAQIPPWLNLDTWGAYGGIYRRQVWVNIVVSKLAKAQARLPLKVYLRDDLNRPEAPNSPYAQLLRKPSPTMSRYEWWRNITSTYDIYGEAFAYKQRDQGGRPIALRPMHPTCMTIDDLDRDNLPVWRFENGKFRIEKIRNHDLFHPHDYNPDDEWRGLSTLEPLRRTLEFEDAAQRAQSSFWRRGARPGFVLKHPKTLSKPAGDRLIAQFQDLAGGANNTGKTVLLEEGMDAAPLTISATEAAYIDSRKLNREEVCGAYDIPPPVVHILDRATFSNITEQMRSMYRDTMAPRLKFFEDQLEQDVRSSVQPGRDEPDFGGDVYAEFLLDEVLRGDFEVRAEAYQKADWMTLAEKRRAENLPFIEGTDALFVNAAQVPLEGTAYNIAAALIRAGWQPEAILNALGLPPMAHTGALPITIQAEEIQQPAIPAVSTVRTVMGRLSRQKSLEEVNPDELVEGLDSHAALIRAGLNASKAVGEDIVTFRRHIKALSEEPGE